MPLKFMYITNVPAVAKVAEAAGVDRIFVDLEYIGKSDRQGGMDTVQNHHTFDDVRKIRQVINNAELLVRINPIHNGTKEFCRSEDEIESVINAGADILMLPYFKTVGEVERFIKAVGGRAKTILLVETPEAVECIDEILSIDNIDEMYIGLNDLSLGYGKTFMFELLVDGTVEKLCEKFNAKGLPYGFGGIASIGKGKLPSELIIKEHYRLGSSSAILSRSFCNMNSATDLDDVNSIFTDGVREIRLFEKMCEDSSVGYSENTDKICRIVHRIVEEMK